MSGILIAWIGDKDIQASKGRPRAGSGPIACAVEDQVLDRCVLLCNYRAERGRAYRDWLARRTQTPIELDACPFEDPTDFRRIYEAASGAVGKLPSDAQLFFHLSPGTPAMATVWILLAQTRYRDRSVLLKSSPERGVENVDLPFDVYAEIGPDLLRQPDDEIVRLTQGLPEKAGEFDDIVHRCSAMQRVIAMARRLALYGVSVLIQGESGTGKELFARAIHAASRRSGKEMVTVNCGALSTELVDSALFGHTRGAFTGAHADHPGFFEAADGSTIFLDEIGELSAAAQVRLLRVIENHTICRVGDTRERKVDVRVIAATHRDLLAMVGDGSFREDLFFRLAVGSINLPPLRDRKGDLSLLIDHVIAGFNEDAGARGGHDRVEISPAARALARKQLWPGNMRELKNVLVRASIWAGADASITEEDLRRSLLTQAPRGQEILNRPLGGGFCLDELCGEVQRTYIHRALEQTHAHKTKAAALLGISRQTMDKRMKKLGMKKP